MLCLGRHDHRLRQLAPAITARSTSADIIATLSGNADKGRNMVRRLPALLGTDRAPCPHGCDRALDFAILTAADKRDPALVARLDAVAGRVLG